MTYDWEKWSKSSYCDKLTALEVMITSFPKKSISSIWINGLIFGLLASKLMKIVKNVNKKFS